MKANIAESIHSLAAPEWGGKIRFIHSGDGKEHSFTSVVNNMSNDRLSYFDSEAPSVNDSKTWVKSVVRDIKNKAEVLEIIGDFN